MQKHLSDTSHNTFMHSKRELKIAYYLKIIHILEPSRVLSEVAGPALSVAVVVRRNHNNFLSLFNETQRKFIDHNSQASNGRPAAYLRCAEDDGTQCVEGVYQPRLTGNCAYLGTLNTFSLCLQET